MHAARFNLDQTQLHALVMNASFELYRARIANICASASAHEFIWSNFGGTFEAVVGAMCASTN